MKKKMIWTIAVIMGISFLALLYLQLMYMRSMAQMKREQFDESVNRALYSTARNLELNETLRYLEKDVNETERKAFRKDSVGTLSGSPDGSLQKSHQFSVVGNDGTIYSSFELKTITTKPATMPKGIILNTDKNAINEATRSMQEILHNRYVYQKALLDEVVYSILLTSSDKPLKERINFKLLDQDLKAELMNNGINIPYHFVVQTHDGREVYRCPDYEETGNYIIYNRTLFHNDPPSKMGVMKVHFPDVNRYIYSSVRFMIPSLIFTLVLLITFVFTLYVVFRQKKLSEIKNDFINNMTHELKTPISSISLAAQMLNDSSVAKNEKMMTHLGGIIGSESKRLRFLVDKVLQMSMFDKQKVIYKKKELDVNEMVEQVLKTFQLRVSNTGGNIDLDVEAVDSLVFVDEMHFKNAISNLFDNAVKYGKPDKPLNLFVKTWNSDDEHIAILIQDNGLGIKKENIRKVFEKFYRVHTGNVHNVKGFGLGLAYVKQIVDIHGGTIRCDSEYGKGTTFIIKLPIIKDN